MAFWTLETNHFFILNGNLCRAALTVCQPLGWAALVQPWVCWYIACAVCSVQCYCLCLCLCTVCSSLPSHSKHSKHSVRAYLHIASIGTTLALWTTLPTKPPSIPTFQTATPLAFPKLLGFLHHFFSMFVYGHIFERLLNAFSTFECLI